jgi:3'-5' exoribonuclease
VTTIVELAEDRVVEGVYGVARKERLRTKTGTPYLALELVDPSGRIDARVWQDVELLDGRFGEGDAVRVLGRVERFRDRLQLAVRSIEAAAGVDPHTMTPALRRDADELEGFLEFLTAEIAHAGLRRTVQQVLADRALRDFPATLEDHHSYAGGLLEHTVGVTTLCRETAQLHPRLRADLLLAAALLHDVGRTLELGRGPVFRQTDEGHLLGHVHLGLRLVEERAAALDAQARTELLHAISVHHDARGARTAEAAVLYHANQLDAVAATRPVPQAAGHATQAHRTVISDGHSGEARAS